MRKIKEVLRLRYELKLDQRQVARSCSIAVSTVHDYLTRWNDDGTIERAHHALYVKCREAAGRQANPTACVIDSQSVKSAEKGGFGSIRPGTMRARRSPARSGISWSIR